MLDISLSFSRETLTCSACIVPCTTYHYPGHGLDKKKNGHYDYA